MPGPGELDCMPEEGRNEEAPSDIPKDFKSPGSTSAFGSRPSIKLSKSAAAMQPVARPSTSIRSRARLAAHNVKKGWIVDNPAMYEGGDDNPTRASEEGSSAQLQGGSDQLQTGEPAREAQAGSYKDNLAGDVINNDPGMAGEHPSAHAPQW